MAAIEQIPFEGTTGQHPYLLYVKKEQRALHPTMHPKENMDQYIRRHEADYLNYQRAVD